MMRNFLLLVTIMTGFITAVSAQSSGSIKGEGNVVKETISLDKITGFNLSINAEVLITQGSSQSVMIEGQKNIIDNIRKTVKGGIWNIGYEKNVSDTKPVTVYITLSTLQEVGLSGSGHIRSTNSFSNLGTLEINVAGSGDVFLSCTAQETEVNISGSGEVRLTGKASALDIAMSGSGNVNASEYTTKGCEVAISGSGDAKVRVDGPLSTSISGSGNVYYTGETQVSARVTGSGSVRKM